MKGFFGCVLGLLAVFSVGCTPKPSRGAEARLHFLKIVQVFKTGGLAATFSKALLPGQQADLNALLIEARELVTAEDFNSFKSMLGKAGPKIGSLCALASAKSSALQVLGTKSKDMPRALGLDDFESFKARDARGILEALDRGIVSDLLKAEDVRARVDSLVVDVVQEEGDWARLRFRSVAPDNSSTEEVIEVIAQEDQWLPAAWVNDWGSTMEGLRTAVAQLKEARKQDPEIVKKGLAEFAKLLDDPAALFALFTPKASAEKSTY